MRAILTILLSLFIGGQVQAEIEVPKLSQRVTDLTGTLSASQVQALNEHLASFETTKGSQVAVLMLPTTRPETIEQFGIRVAEAWKLGRKGIDDGVILLIAKRDRKMRIEVGYGLEGPLNDATARRILNEVMIPNFNRDNYYSGIEAGVSEILAVIEKENLPAPELPSPANTDKADLTSYAPVIGVVVMMLVLGNLILPKYLGRWKGSLLIGGSIGWVTWAMLLGQHVSNAVPGINFMSALMAGWFTFWLSAFVFYRETNSRKGHDGSTGSDSSSSSGDSGSGSDSGYSGGGGDFGGGGASSDSGSDSGGGDGGGGGD